MSERLQSAILNNVLWFLASLIIAILVWFVATIEVNPINTLPFSRVDIQIEVDEGMIITSRSSQTSRVIVRAQQSTLDLLQQDDITVRADLHGKSSGSYTVPLQVDIARSGLASADTRPAQITVTIEQQVAQQIPISIDIIPPSDIYTYDPPSYDLFQAEVSGASSDVSKVRELVARIDLSEQRSEAVVEDIAQLIPTDENGSMVQNVTVTPRQISVSVNVSERDDARSFVVRPDIQFDTLPANFEFRNVSTDPDTVIITGSPEDLLALGDTVRTEPISLEGWTSDFAVDVALALPEDSQLLVLSDTGKIHVEISIAEQTTTLPLENIPINLIGLSDSTTARVTPEVISLVLNGPVSLLSDITDADVQALLDVNGLEAGTYDLVPQIIIRNGQVVLDASDITLFPSKVSVAITVPQPEATAEATVEATSEAGE